MTSQAAPIFFGIVEDSERDAAMKRLVETVRQAKHHPEFGILGAKMVPRVLSENGYIDDVYPDRISGLGVLGGFRLHNTLGRVERNEFP